MLTAMVLCAGSGQRLRPLTDELPKPLVPIGDRALLSHILERLAASGVERALVNTHHLSQHFAEVVRLSPIPVLLLHEPAILGTAGGLAAARMLFGREPVIVCNGDILLQFSANPLLEALARGETNVLLAAASQSGTVGVGEADNVASLRGEVFGRVTRQLDYVGVMAMPPERLEGLPNEGCLIGDFILPQLRRGERVAVVETSSVWRDVGTVPSYWQANLSWLKTHAGEGQSWVGKGARMAVGVELKCSVVGAGARIEGRGFLENCVVWPDAVVVAPLRDAVVTRLGRVVQL